MVLFDAVRDRTSVCPSCYKAIKERGFTLLEYNKMAEQYNEELVNWDKDTQTGDVKVTKLETVDFQGRQNVHSQESLFERTNIDELQVGLEGLQSNKETVDKKLKEFESKITKIKEDIKSIDGKLTLTEELLKLQRDIKNIGMIQEIEKIQSQITEAKDNITDVDAKILARIRLLNTIKEQ